MKRVLMWSSTSGYFSMNALYRGENFMQSSCFKTKTDFYKLKVDSSHPDILEGAITGFAALGTYEFEVRGMARTEKELAFGFPDKDQTPVGLSAMKSGATARV